MSLLSDTTKTNAFKYFALFYVTAMFLPRLVVQGMFGDGLLYSSIARNMAIDKGSMWSPFFSSSYWLDNVLPIYYENPPLMLWLESLFFRVLGDYWWVEKVFSLVILVINCFLMLKIWQFFEKKYIKIKGLGYFVLIFWHLMPRVLWGNPNNMMDNNLLTFCLLSILFIVKAITNKKTSQIIDNQQNNTPSVFSQKSLIQRINSSFIIHHSSLFLAAFCIFLGILTKGPVALYPLSIPILFYFFTKEITFKKAFNYTLILTSLSSLFFIGLLYLNEQANFYFMNYWEQRLLAVIVGSRDDMKLSGWQHLEIVETLFVELLPILIVFLIVYLILKYKKIDVSINKKSINFGLFFTFLGFAATLPIIISTKQSGIYLIPGLPMFAFAATFFSVSFFENRVNLPQFSRFSKRLTYFSWVGLAVSLIYSGIIAGDYGRDKLLLSDVAHLKKIIPQDAEVGVCFQMMNDFTYHVNLQRFCRFELRKNTPTDFFLTRKIECDSVHQDSLKLAGYTPISTDNNYFVIYKHQ
jgi:4-amino-4-deoxy-L-arabinose transferase-like glycosyltransferase